MHLKQHKIKLTQEKIKNIFRKNIQRNQRPKMAAKQRGKHVLNKTMEANKIFRSYSLSGQNHNERKFVHAVRSR